VPVTVAALGAREGTDAARRRGSVARSRRSIHPEEAARAGLVIDAVFGAA